MLILQRPPTCDRSIQMSRLPRLESRLPRLESRLPRLESRLPRLEPRLPRLESRLPRLDHPSATPVLSRHVLMLTHGRSTSYVFSIERGVDVDADSA
jgi:hypothetical protein